jgi:5-methylcytosine-specific restriction endonuclease McrA
MLGIDLDRADHGNQDDLRIVASPAARALSQLVLRTDIAGMPLEWIDYKEAARLYHQEQVAYTCGSPLYKLYGGVNAASGQRTVLEVNSIVATVGHTGNPGNTRHDYVPPLNNQTLFRRDAYLCMYCGMRFASRELSRDHIRPFSQGGVDIWTNVVTACRRCNNQKASRTPEQAKMHLCGIYFPQGAAGARGPDGVSARALPTFEPTARSHPALARMRRL